MKGERGRSRATLNSKRCILYIYSTNIGTEYLKHGICSAFFFLWVFNGKRREVGKRNTEKLKQRNENNETATRVGERKICDTTVQCNSALLNFTLSNITVQRRLQKRTFDQIDYGVAGTRAGGREGEEEYVK